MTLQLQWYPADGSAHLTFNTASTDYRLLKRFDGFSFIPVTHYTVKFPYQHGVSLTNSDATQRNISFDIMVLGTSAADVEAKIKTLSTKFNPLIGTGWLYYTNSAGTTYRIKAIMENGRLDMTQGRGALYQKVTINLVAHEPFWYSGVSTIIFVAPPGLPMFEVGGGVDGLQFGFGATGWQIGMISSNPVFTNAGSFDTPVKMTINGPIENPVLTNQTTGKNMSLTIEMLEGDVFVVDTTAGAQYAEFTPISTGIAVNGMPYVDVTADFWQLIPGSNQIVLTSTTSSSPANASIEWSDRYAGI